MKTIFANILANSVLLSPAGLISTLMEIDMDFYGMLNPSQVAIKKLIIVFPISNIKEGLND